MWSYYVLHNCLTWKGEKDLISIKVITVELRNKFCKRLERINILWLFPYIVDIMSFSNEVILTPDNQSLSFLIPILCLRRLGQKLAAGEDLTGAGWFTTVPRELRARETAGSAVGVATWAWPSAAAAWRERKKTVTVTLQVKLKSS